MPASPSPVFLLAGGPGTRGGPYLPLLRDVLALPGKPRPRVAYLGAATDDAPGFTAMMERLVRSAADCAFQLAPVAGRKGARGGAREVLAAADVVFLGGGDVELGMRRLRERELVDLLGRRHADGVPFLGISAGAILLCRSWVRWRDPDDDATAERFACLGLAPVLCDCHGEEDGWGELAALLRLSGPRAVGHGIRSGAALRVAPDGTAETLCGKVDRLALRRGRIERR